MQADRPKATELLAEGCDNALTVRDTATKPAVQAASANWGLEPSISEHTSCSGSPAARETGRDRQLATGHAIGASSSASMGGIELACPVPSDYETCIEQAIADYAAQIAALGPGEEAAWGQGSP